jgi:hypothetical protein
VDQSAGCLEESVEFNLMIAFIQSIHVKTFLQKGSIIHKVPIND